MYPYSHTLSLHVALPILLKHGPIRRRVGLAVLGRQPVREGAMVVDVDGDEVGKVTSGGFSPCLEAPIAMAYVPTASAEPGTDIRLASERKSTRLNSSH